MAGITLRTARQVVPMIYAYTTSFRKLPAQRLTKIGYTEQSVDKTPETADSHRRCAVSLWSRVKRRS